ncbi:MAG TPA: hypothetical protein VMR16_01880 [Candidatus Saccharimonadales bacterium]|nr:hypothetical protein [Candidatus Saccharimonadales bacterium]
MTPENLGYLSKPDAKPVNISDCVGVSVETAQMLDMDIAQDPELLKEVLTNEYGQLINGQSRPGEPFIHPDIDTNYKLMQMLDAIDKIEPKGRTYPKHNVWYKTHWTSGTKDIKHLIIGLGYHSRNPDSFRAVSGQPRIALNDGKNFMAKFAHHTNQPYDKENLSDEDRAHGVHTQLESLSLDIVQFKTENPGFYLTSLDVASIAWIVCQKHIKGESLKDAFGAMAIPDLGRRAIMGDSRVRVVYCGPTEQIGLGSLRGDPSPGMGIGQAVGHK